MALGRGLDGKLMGGLELLGSTSGNYPQFCPNENSLLRFNITNVLAYREACNLKLLLSLKYE